MFISEIANAFAKATELLTQKDKTLPYRKLLKDKVRTQNDAREVLELIEDINSINKDETINKIQDKLLDILER